MKEKEKGFQKNKPHIVKATVEIPNLDIKYQKKKKRKRKKQQKNIKDVMIMMIMMMMILMMR